MRQYGSQFCIRALYHNLEWPHRLWMIYFYPSVYWVELSLGWPVYGAFSAFHPLMQTQTHTQLYTPTYSSTFPWAVWEECSACWCREIAGWQWFYSWVTSILMWRKGLTNTEGVCMSVCMHSNSAALSAQVKSSGLTSAIFGKAVGTHPLVFNHPVDSSAERQLPGQCAPKPWTRNDILLSL